MRRVLRHLVAGLGLRGDFFLLSEERDLPHLHQVDADRIVDVALVTILIILFFELITIFLVDVVLGPGLTLMVFKPGKPGLKFDMAAIVVLQMVALSWREKN